MMHDVQASLKVFIEKAAGAPCVWIFDGAKLPATRPITTIEALPTIMSQLTKGRETIQSKYRFQIGVLCKNSVQASQLPQHIAELLMFNKVDLIDTATDTIVGSFEATVERVTPVPADTIDSAEKHKNYIDVTVSRIFSSAH